MINEGRVKYLRAKRNEYVNLWDSIEEDYKKYLAILEREHDENVRDIIDKLAEIDQELGIETPTMENGETVPTK